MASNVFQNLKGLFSPNGKDSPVKEPGQSSFSNSEIGLLKLRLREGVMTARKEQEKRGRAVHPKIAARKAKTA